MLEYIWAGPIVATGGDATSNLLAGHGLGVVVPVGATATVATAIDRLLSETTRGAGGGGVCCGTRGVELGAGGRAVGTVLPGAGACAGPRRRDAGGRGVCGSTHAATAGGEGLLAEPGRGVCERAGDAVSTPQEVGSGGFLGNKV